MERYIVLGIGGLALFVPGVSHAALNTTPKYLANILSYDSLPIVGWVIGAVLLFGAALFRAYRSRDLYSDPEQDQEVDAE